MADKSKTKKVAGMDLPSSSFLVIEDPEETSKWHLAVKNADGTPNRRLMGAAKAALTSAGGHRGNTYQGPNKEEAIKKLKAMYKSENMEFTLGSNIMFVELSAANLGPKAKDIDGLAPGSFRDMWGTIVSVNSSKFPDAVANTKEMIEATRGASGELAGLPIDANNHDKTDAAGWIKDCYQEGELVRLKVEWTELGENLISKKIRRFFSATLNPETLTIHGGSLTNWPATKGPKGEYLLRPIELSDANGNQFYEFAEVDKSMDEKISMIRNAFYNNYSNAAWVCEVFDDYIVVCDSDGDNWKVPYEYANTPADEGTNDDDEDNIEFSPKSEWKEVKKTWVEMAAQLIKNAVNGGANAGTTTSDNVTPPVINNPVNELSSKENDMTVKKWSEMTPEEKVEYRNAMLAEMVAGGAPVADIAPDMRAQVASILGNPAIANLSNMEEAGAIMRDEMEKVLLSQYENLKVQQGQKLAELVQEIHRKDMITNLSSDLTMGKNDAKRGLPIKTSDLEAFMLTLNPAQFTQAKALFTQIVDGGLAEFGENGVEGAGKVTEKLPEAVSNGLRTGAISIAELADPILGLGDLAKYDLSEFKKVEK